MTEGQLASSIGVDQKTVSRWITDAGRVPHPRHRWAVSAALEVEEEMLWPTAARAAIKTGHGREVVAAYPTRSAIPKSLWRELITGATRQLVFAGYTSYFTWLEIDGLHATLARKLDARIPVRFLIGDPDSQVTRDRERIENVPLTVSTRIAVTVNELGRLREQSPGVEARYSDRHIALSVFLFDDQAFVCTHLADLLGHDSPTLHLKRRETGGLYDRFASHTEHLWSAGRPIWPQLDRKF